MNVKTAIRPTRRRVAVLGAVAGVAALTLTAATGSASAAKAEHGPSQPKPTVVLVHGAFADSSSWNGVIERLRHEGYPVIAPANPLRGLAGDAAYIHSVLKSVSGPVVLVGHSYGGAVISEAAVDSPQVKALVYIAAFAPEKGESALELSNKFPPPWTRRRRRPPGRPSPPGTSSPPRTSTSRRPRSASWPSAPTRTPSRSRRRTPSRCRTPARSPA
ncbi:alpha/beta hydrolase [Streptomyces sp. NPDC001185]|uniref:alpha/beta fold hydrolase n=1 Tax=Streptomyces sp. NPDC001185 TaxID=3154380 RepID=UPI003327443F